MKKYDISVIIALHKINKNLEEIRSKLYQATKSVEIIYVVDKSLARDLIKKQENEKIILKNNIGRGFMFKYGVQEALGDIVVLLHSDTLLPTNWDDIIVKTMKNSEITAGAFSLSFDQSNLYLHLVIKMVTWIYHKTGILSGDRAIFVRSDFIKNNIHLLETPIFEDVQLSKNIKKQGKLILLDDEVTTSADAFKKNGMIRHTFRIIFCSFWFRVGGDVQKIFRYYYH